MAEEGGVLFLPRLAFIWRNPFLPPQGQRSPWAGSSKGGKDASLRPPCLVVPPSPTQAGALWWWLHDTAATLGRLRQPPLSGGQGREQAALGDGVEGMTEASEVHMHASWH